MKEHPKVSIIVACRNEEKFISKCIHSILKQKYPKNKMEILIVDGKSQDKTRKIVRNISQKEPTVELIDNPKKITPAAFNIGIQNATGKIVMIMGSHAEYKDNYIYECVKTLKKHKADNVGGVLKTKPSKNTLTAKAIAECLSNFFGVGNSHFRKGAKEITEVDTVFGGCYKKKIFEKIGLFNENIVRNQDFKLNSRLKKSGGKIMLNPNIIAYYYPKSNLWNFAKHNFDDGFWITYPIKLGIVAFSWRHIISLIFVLLLLILIFLSIFSSIFLNLLGIIFALYIIASIIFSVNIIKREQDLRYLFLMPIVFGSRHLFHGLGSLWGMIKGLTYRLTNEKKN